VFSFRCGSNHGAAGAEEDDMKGSHAIKTTTPEPASLSMLQFLAWIADRPRSYPEAREGWHSCPHLSVWEDAIIDGLMCIENGGDRAVKLTPRGKAMLETARAHAN
jgi:hypothetical protein